MLLGSPFLAWYVFNVKSLCVVGREEVQQAMTAPEGVSTHSLTGPGAASDATPPAQTPITTPASTPATTPATTTATTPATSTTEIPKDKE
ncbi:unnamed protein product [Danaus chrysippus]|uniref:(African queen) hypothetical protein n=1 Tax=Danaus chrysippus TaxID=151541 RepID=A0A8J2WAB3_9NEOP|nr:unnamed protein product [Danaus chrysippus]